MVKTLRNFILLSILLIISNLAIGQVDFVKVMGTIIDAEGKPISGAHIILENTAYRNVSNLEGQYEIGVAPGTYIMSISSLGMNTLQKDITLTLDQKEYIEDFLMTPSNNLLADIIVTGTFNKNTRFASSIASSTLLSKEIKNSGALGTAELLSNVTGTFTDASAGSVFTRVYSRGISSSAEEDIGWYYMSLQEDGLPISNYQTTYYSPDLFHRADLTTLRLEAVRGGSAMITSANAPGGIFNFISKSGNRKPGIEMVATGGLQGENNLLARYDINLNGNLSDKGYSYNIGGFYRFDEGARNTDINWENGGQLKANISKRSKNGIIKIYGKYLNDKVNRYQGLAATNWADPQPAFGHDYNSTALNLPKITTNITDGRFASDDSSSSYVYDTDKGIQTKDLAIGFTTAHAFNEWNISSNIKVSSKSADWNSTIANQPLGLEGFFPYLLSGVDPTFQNIPLGQVVFRDARSKEVIARVNNFGILGPFEGLPPSFEYIEGSLPNDAVMGIAPWKKIDEATEFMGELKINTQVENHSVTSGAYFGYSDLNSFTSASYAYATYENNPRALYVTLENEGQPIVELSDESGISNYGGLLYNRGDAKINQFSLFLNDNIQVGKNLNIDAGFRYETIGHKGEKDRSSPSFAPGGIDGDETTAYNNSVLLATEKDAFDFTYDYFNWSLGFNYLISDELAFFARASNGHKAPEMNYYLNNFGGVPIDKAGTIQDIFQGEYGIKYNTPKTSLFSTLFYSRLDNIGFSEFVLDQQDGSVFFTPIQLNQTTTIGLELEGNYSLTTHLGLNVKATLQKAEATRFNVYDTNETVDPIDDVIIDYSGNKVPHNPSTMLQISPNYTTDKFDIFASWRYMGQREGNVANAFQLPAFSTLNMGLAYQLNGHINIALIANNIFNSTGLMNFFGPNEFGSNSNAATEEYIAENPDASFVVFPISPRSLFLKVGYSL